MSQAEDAAVAALLRDPEASRWTPEALAGDTLALAPALLGSWLVRRTPEGLRVGRIVETEAYLAEGDAACHAHRGPTPRNRTMFAGPGHGYVYRCYGVHWCFNVVTEPEGRGAAVLVRALEPVAGEEAMGAARRGRRPLASGPGRLCEALDITGALDGCDLTAPGPLTLWRPARGSAPALIDASPRVGITRAVEHPWRFFLRDHPDVSHGPRPAV